MKKKIGNFFKFGYLISTDWDRALTSEISSVPLLALLKLVL